jgi:glycosyltransferase involved in cell wall biosynthesis
MKAPTTASVIIPAYNAAPWIAEAIRSVLNQDFPELELIVVNDGSTDETEEIASAFGDRIRIVTKPNGGSASARNAGLRVARGEYIAFLDGDDLWTRDKLRLQMNFLKRNSLRWVYCDGYSFQDGTGEMLSRFGDLWTFHRGHILEHLYVHNFIPSGSPVISRSIFEELGGFDERVRFAEDWEMWLRIAAAYPTDFVQKPLFLYRLHGANSTRDENILSALHQRVVVVNRAAQREPSRLAKLKPRSLASCFEQAGRVLARNRSLPRARTMFFNALLLNPVNLRVCFFWICTFLGDRLLSKGLQYRGMRRRNVSS